MSLPEPLVALPEQPLCVHYTGATLADQRGDYECKCRAGIPYDRLVADMDRWPCRKRSLLGVGQQPCDSTKFQ